MADAGRSKRLQRITFGAQTEEEARAKLQERLATFAKVLFWSFVALIAFLFAMYAAYPDLTPHKQSVLYGVATIAFAILAFVWRVLLVRGARSVETLQSLDLVITVGSGCVFGASACLAYNLNASAYTCLLYESFVVFTRALLIPSTARRTLVVSALAFIPIVIGAIILAVLDAKGYAKLEIPGIAFVAGDVLYNAVAIILAMRGSAIIYELRRDITEAKQFGQYTLGRRLGGGGMGEVFEAKHALLRRPTAIKLMRPDKIGAENLRRFRREVEMTSQLTHPNTVAVFDYGRTPDGILYYVMEYLAGINLQDLVTRHGALPFDRVVEILKQAASALTEAHAAGLIHRDIKPGNIILCERGGIPDFVKVLDFGLVKDITTDTRTSTHIVIGTPDYIAPELISDPNNVKAPADIYALGVVGYFLLTKQTVFEGTALQVLTQKGSRPPRPFAEVTERAIPEPLAAVVMKCLSKEPADRPTSAAALATALDAVPHVGDWTRADATEFWTAFAARLKATPSVDAPTQTMDIDPDRLD